MRCGYTRVSTKNQNIEVQVDELVIAGVGRAHIFTDVDVDVSGKRVRRPGLDSLREVLEASDEVVVTKLDRLGRSMIHIAQLTQEFRDNGIGFKSLKDSVDTSTASGRTARWRSSHSCDGRRAGWSRWRLRDLR